MASRTRRQFRIQSGQRLEERGISPLSERQWGVLRTTQADEQVLRNWPLAVCLNRELLNEVAQHAMRRALERGDALWQSGDEATHFTQILSGLIKISRISPEGAESIVAIFGPGESIGDTAVVQRGRYPADAIALSSDVEVLRIEAAPILRAMERNAGLMEGINTILLHHTQALDQKIRIMTAGSVPHRLATLFLQMAERFGRRQQSGATEIPIRLSRVEIAGLVGATVETTIRALSRWQKQRVLTTTSAGFLLHHPERLREELHSEE